MLGWPVLMMEVPKGKHISRWFHRGNLISVCIKKKKMIYRRKKSKIPSYVKAFENVSKNKNKCLAKGSPSFT